MKKLYTLMVALVMIFTTTVAQEDITPSRYDFTNLPVGQFKINATNAGANPPVAWTVPVDGFDDGYVVLAGAPPFITALDAPQPAAIQEGLNIVDLGGDVGKVLVFRGKNSHYDVGAKMGSEYAGAWFNFNFYFDKDNTPTVADLKKEGYSEEEAKEKAKVRVRLVFSIAENEISSTGSLVNSFFTQNWQNNVSPVTAETPEIFPSDAFQTTDEEGDPVPNDDGEAFYDPTKWMIYEFDTWVPEAAGNPNRLKINIAATAGNGSLLIKEMKFIKEPVGEPIVREMITLVPDISSDVIVNKADRDALDFSVSGNRVSLVGVDAGANVSVYSITGQVVSSFITQSANDSFELSSGFYIVKAGGKTAKISIR